MSALVGIGAFLSSAAPAAAQKYAKLAPFSAVQWRDLTPRVQVYGTWYDLLAIDDVPREEIVAFCRAAWPDKWQKRFEEDLVEVLTRMNHPPGPTVTLRLRRLDTNETVEKPGVEMTRENRQALWRVRFDALRARRSKAKGASFWSQSLPAEVIEDIDQLQEALETQYSYLRLKEFDYHTALTDLRTRCAGGLSRREFALALTRILAGFGDAHARVHGRFEFFPKGSARLAIADLDGRLVALQPDRSALLDPQHPYLQRLDGVDAQRWIAAAAALVADGSPQFRRSRAIEYAHWTQLIRGELGRKTTDTIRVDVQDDTGGRNTTLELQVVDQPPRFVNHHSGRRMARLEGNIGYLPIPEMRGEPGRLTMLDAAMKQLRNTDGLIIDVRGNRGGGREILRAMFPWFMQLGDSPRVVNAAKYRMHPGDRRDELQGYLEDRGLYPLSAAVWTEAEHAAVKRFAAAFKPEWTPPAEEFSAWHYMVVSPDPDRSNACYDRPVVILLDERCISATDVFLAAFKGWRNVTLIGRPSAGGSGRSRSIKLQRSRLNVRLSSMASFQPDGLLYDGNGIRPDIFVQPTLEDLMGTTDTTLAAALEHLRGAEGTNQKAQRAP